MQHNTQHLATHLANRRTGFSLEQRFYADPSVYVHDLDMLHKRWFCAGHVSDMPNRGDYITAELGPDSAIIIRGNDGEVRAFHNVCRHRGSRICLEAKGHAPLLVCPYHAWSYELDGKLKAARQMSAGFDAADYGLKPAALSIIEGVIFVSFDSDPVALTLATPALKNMFSAYGWADAKVAHRALYAVDANWKLAMENYHECYHCTPSHQEFSKLHTLAKPKVQRIESEQALMANAPACGIDVAEFEAWPVEPDDEELVRVIRSSLYGGTVTGSEDGQPVAPLMGNIKAYDGGCSFAELGYLSSFLAYADHGLIYRFIPRGVQRTEIEVIWLVCKDAVAGTDYSLEKLTWLWHVTSLADKKIIEINQAGVNSSAYEPGPYSLMEPGTQLYVERYAHELEWMLKSASA